MIRIVHQFFNYLGSFYELEGVRYGYSSMGTKIVLNDPYQKTFGRFVIVGTILIMCLYYVHYLTNVYFSIPEEKPSSSGIAGLRPSEKKRLIVLSILSLITSGLHNDDNLLRVVDYFGYAFLYHGIFFVVDIGLYFWTGVATLLFNGVMNLVEDKGNTLISFIMIIYYCFCIWVSPIGHYNIEPMRAYSDFANLTIMLETIFSAILNLYVIYLVIRVYCLGGSNDQSTNLYQQVPLEVVEIDNAKASVEMEGVIRRRSKDFN